MHSHELLFSRKRRSFLNYRGTLDLCQKAVSKGWFIDGGAHFLGHTVSRCCDKTTKSIVFTNSTWPLHSTPQYATLMTRIQDSVNTTSFCVFLRYSNKTLLVWWRCRSSFESAYLLSCIFMAFHFCILCHFPS